MKKLCSLLPVFLIYCVAGCNNATHKEIEITGNDVQNIITSIDEKDSLSLKQRIKGFDVNTFDRCGVSLLTHGVMTGDIRMVSILIEHGANPNVKNKTTMGSTPLMMASENESLGIARYLIEHGADINIQDNNGDPAIHWSAYVGNIPFTTLMLDNRAKTDVKSIHSDGVMQVALKEWQYSVVDLLLERGITVYKVQKNSQDVIHAVKTNNPALTKSLLNKNNSNDRDGAGNTLLMIASEKGYMEIVEYLVSIGCDMDAMNSVGQTALNNAVYFRNNGIATYLIEQGADINRTDTRFILPPLVAAIRSNNLEMGKILLAKGAAINTTDGTNNFSPIMWATLYQNKDFVSHLLKYNPDLSIVSKYNTTVFEMTRDKDLLTLLKKE